MFTEFALCLYPNLMASGFQTMKLPVEDAVLNNPNFTLWVKLEGSTAHYAAVYDMDRLTDDEAGLISRSLVQGYENIADTNNLRMNIIFNIYVGQKISENSKNKIDKGEEFYSQSVYDINYGVGLRRGELYLNEKQPVYLKNIEKNIKLAINQYIKKDEIPKAVPEEITAHEINKMYLDTRIKTQIQPVAKKPVAMYVVMAVNVTFFLLMELSGGSTHTDVLIRFGALDRMRIMQYGEWYRLVTPMFLHIGFLHIFFNSASLFLFGTSVEKYFGHLSFVLVYLLSGIGGCFFSFLFSNAISAGASGAIFGLMGAMLALTRFSGKSLGSFNYSSLTIMILVSVFMGFTQPNIGNAAHIGGLLTGLIVGYIIAKKENRYGRRIRRTQKKNR